MKTHRSSSRLLLAAFVALSALGMAGCSSTADYTVPSANPAQGEPVTLEIFSLPKGCVVEMNGEYIGGTPVKIEVPATADGRWQGPPSVTHVIKVSTPNNRSVETRKFRGGERIPHRLLFRPPYAHMTGTSVAPGV